MSIFQHILNNPSKAKAEFSLLEFTKQAWPVLEPGVQFQVGWAVEAIAEHLQAVTEGQIKRLLVNVPPGMSKPGSVDNLVACTTGRKRLGDIEVGDQVLTHRGRYRTVLAVHEQGEMDLLRITTNSGRQILAEPTHPCLTPRGWIPAGELQVGENLAMVSPCEDPHEDQITPEAARLLGYICGDGSVTQAAPVFTNMDDDTVDDFIHCANSLGFTTAKIKYKGRTAWTVRINGGEPVREWFRAHQMYDVDSYTKRIPDCVLASSNAVLANFVGAYWTCDGSMDIRQTASRGSTFRTFLSTVSKGLAHDTLHALGRLGIRGRVRTKRSKVTTKRQPGGEYISYHVEVHSEPDTSRILDLPGLTGRKRKNRGELRTRFNSVLNEDPITSIEPTGRGECRCLTVEEDSSFTWDDLAVHNSMLTNVFHPAWEWGPRGLASHRFISASYEQGLAGRDLVRGRDLVKSEWFQERWPIEFKDDQDQKTYYENTQTGWRKASSVRSALTGYRGDRIIIDDPHSVKTAESEADRAEALRWFTETVPTRLNTKDSAIIIIMQRLHEQDISGLILSTELGQEYTHLMLPMEYESDRGCSTTIVDMKTGNPFEDPRTGEGELLFPERFDRDSVDSLKRALRSFGGTYAEASQLQQRPAPRGGGRFKRDHFKIWKGPLPEGRRRTRGWDLAASKGSRSAFTAGVLMSQLPDGRIVIEDIVRDRMDPFDVEERIRVCAQVDGPNTRTSIPQDPGAAGVAWKAHMAKKLGGHDVHFSPESGDKDTRALGLAAQVEAGMVYLVEAGWNAVFLSEAAAFGPGAAFKDQIDASTRAYSDLVSAPVEDIGIEAGTLFLNGQG